MCLIQNPGPTSRLDSAPFLKETAGKRPLRLKLAEAEKLPAQDKSFCRSLIEILDIVLPNLCDRWVCYHTVIAVPEERALLHAS